jgi:hypothetical protein
MDHFFPLNCRTPAELKFIDSMVENLYFLPKLLLEVTFFIVKSESKHTIF